MTNNAVEETDEESSDKDVEVQEIAADVVSDEICPDSVYEEVKNDDEEVDLDELARDKIVTKVLICTVTKPIEKTSDVQVEIREKFGGIGIKVIGMKTRSTLRGYYETSIVNISPVNLNKIWGRRLGLKNCSLIAFEM